MYQWVLAQHDPRSERGKSVVTLLGQSYYLVNKERQNGDPIIVAFKHVGYTVPPEFTLVTDPEQIEKLERWDKPWLNREDNRANMPDKSAEEKLDLNAMFPVKKEES